MVDAYTWNSTIRRLPPPIRDDWLSSSVGNRTQRMRCIESNMHLTRVYSGHTLLGNIDTNILICIMDVSGSPNRVSDFPDGDTPWTYGGFAPGPPLGYTRNPSGSGGWLEADDLPIYAMRTTAASEPVIEVVAPLVEEVREPVEPIVAPGTEEIVGPTEPMDAPTIGGDEDMEPLFSASDVEYDPDLHALDDDDIAIEVLLDNSDMDDSAMHVEQVVAPVVPSPVKTTPPPLVAIPEPSVHEVGGSSTAADVRPPSTVEELDTRMDDVGFQHDVLVTRVDTVRDAVTDIRADRDAQIEQLSVEMINVLEREYGLMQMIATMSKRLADVEKRIPGPP
ncbi:hypothetical protein Tco_1034369 [Tanacetum coccineum]